MSKIVVKNTKSKIFLEYIRTVAISFCVALFFTVLLACHARSEMIKNLYMNANEQNKINKQVALKLVQEAGFIKDLNSKNYTICMHIGNIYEITGQYKNAEDAYKIALTKTKSTNYLPYYALIRVLVSQEKFNDAEYIIKSIRDLKSVKLIKFKTRSYIIIGDKYYSIGKFLSAAKNYEKANYYYNRFKIKDKFVEKSIHTRIINAYVQTADVMVKNNLCLEAVRFLKKAEKYDPDDFEIKYKLAILFSDLDPIKSLNYFEPLLEKQPQDVDYTVYNKALMKAANISDLKGDNALAKLYRYKIYSTDVFVNRKVVYKNDIETIVTAFNVKKLWFKYKLNAKYKFKNVSNSDMQKLYAEFVLRQNDKKLEIVKKNCASKAKPFLSNGGETIDIPVVFGKNIFTKKELEQYYIDIYLYKDEKYKTHVFTMKVPVKSFKLQ